jgi:magnesium-transporting ATPase (P-type)
VYGLFVHKRTATEIHVRERTTDGSLKEVVYTILAVLEFSSTRKRMSVVYRVGNGPIRLFCKGACMRSLMAESPDSTALVVSSLVPSDEPVKSGRVCSVS